MTTKKKITNSGVNTNLGSSCSTVAYNWAKKSFSHRKGMQGNLLPTIDGTYSSQLSCGYVRIGISSDGIGTKIEIAERLKKYDTLGYDLMAMAIDDLICNGFEPAFISNILDVDVLDKATVDSLMKGLYNAAKESNVIITGGEIAELGNRIGGYGDGMHFNWGATAIGLLHKNLKGPITGRDVKEGDVILSLYNKGFRSNGYSLLRKILETKYGKQWHSAMPVGIKDSWGKIALTPCTIFSPMVVNLLNKKLVPHGIVHVTGGGIVDNLGRILKVNDVGAELNNLFEPEDYLLQLLQLGNVSFEKAYRYWNMNNGMLLIIPPKAVTKTLDVLKKSKGCKVRVAGRVIRDKAIKIQTAKADLSYTAYKNK
jgi:phosphoribosylformylglycinamidine cyclo-ligase